MLQDTLKDSGFSPAARLTWDDVRQFKFDLGDCDLQNVIYVYADVDTDRVLNVGHTGQSLRGRLRSYEAWLNGRRTKENSRPIRLRWLDCLGGCSRVEVWARPSSPDRAAREVDERGWIKQLRPLLNVRP
jgi:hypothetical protein